METGMKSLVCDTARYVYGQLLIIQFLSLKKHGICAFIALQKLTGDDVCDVRTLNRLFWS